MRYPVIACIVFGLFASGSALAAGDAASGAGKAALCAACHGPAGISPNPLWPNLAGQQEAYLAKQIKAFRDGSRQEPTMAPFVGNLSDQDADDLAAHFASLKGCP
jgi:cytochrome c553